MSNTTPVYRSFTADFTSQIETAQRADGQWFRRFQSRGIYGYQWGRWTAIPAVAAAAVIDGRHPEQKRIRLPKD